MVRADESTCGRGAAAVAARLGLVRAVVAALVALPPGAQAQVSAGREHSPPAARGSQTAQAQSRGGGGYDSSAPQALRGGTSEYRGGQARQGFGCAPGEEWAIVENMIKCGARLDVDSAASNIVTGGKVLHIRARLIDGFVSGILLRIVGTERDMRVDMFNPKGELTSSCYLTARNQQSGRTCDLGSPHPGGLVFANLPSRPVYPTTAGDRNAADIVAGNLAFAGSTAGLSMQDHYIVSVTLTRTHLDVALAGLFHLSGEQESGLRPVYGRGRLSWGEANALTRSATQAIWQTDQSWPGPVAAASRQP